MKTAVVIPNWNGAKVLPVCLAALRDQTLPPDQIILVDNHSTDDSVEAAVRCCPGIRVLELEQNFGFGYAVNRGIEACDTELIFLLNNDTRALPECIAELHRFFSRNPQTLFCACKMLNFFDPTRIDGAGDCLTRSGIPYKIGSGKADGSAYSTEAAVFGACGGGAAFRREFFARVGTFDERFFMYLEDVDLSFRAQLRGLGCRYVPGAVVHHMEAQSDPDRSGQSANPQTPARTYWIARNRVLLLAKNYPASLLVRYSCPIAGAFAKSLLFHLLRTGYGGLFLRGVWRGLCDISTVLPDRRRIQRSMTISTGDLRRLLSQC